MDLKKVDELLRVKGNCQATTDLLIIELLSTIANNTTRLVQLEENKASGLQELPLDNPNVKFYGEAKEELEKKVEEKATKAMDEVKPVKKAPAKKAAPAPKKEPEAKVEVEKVEAELVTKMLTKDEVMPKLIDFISERGEDALAEIIQSLGDYKIFPDVPQEKYNDLIDAIERA